MAVLNAMNREDKSSVNPKQLRSKGIIPMALIQRGKETRMIQAPLQEVRRTIVETNGVGRFDLKLGDDKETMSVIVKEVDRDSVTRKLLHMTLMEVHDDDLIKVDVPVVSKGIPEAVDQNLAVLANPTTHIKVRGRMADIMDSIEIDVSELTEQGHIAASDVQLPEKVELISSPDATLFTLQKIKVVEETTPTEGEGEAAEGEEAEATEEGATEETEASS